MTRTALSLSNLTGNSVINIPAGLPIDQANGMSIAITTTTIPSSSNIDRVILFVQSTSASDQVLTVQAGDNPVPAFEGGKGALAATVHAASGGGFVGPLSSARFIKKDNTILLDFDAGSQGYITALVLPKAW